MFFFCTIHFDTPSYTDVMLDRYLDLKFIAERKLRSRRDKTLTLKPHDLEPVTERAAKWTLSLYPTSRVTKRALSHLSHFAAFRIRSFRY